MTGPAPVPVPLSPPMHIADEEVAASEAIRDHLDDLEDLYLAERELEDVRTGRSQTMSLEAVMKQYGLEG